MDEKIITVEKLQEKLNGNEEVSILDVRPADQRTEWQIAGSTHVDAYKRLNAGDNTVLDTLEIPDNATVVTVCAAGRTSLLASRALQAKGVNAFSLEGGMKAWNYAWNTARLSLNDVTILQIRRTAKGVLSYIMGSNGEAVVIDASLSPKVYQEIANKNGWTIKYVMDTHVHADYVSRTRELASATGAKHLMIDKANVDFDFTPIASGETIKVGHSAIQFLHTPGHTWESTSFVLDDSAIFTGDTLFVDGIGRPDLKAEQSEAIEKSKALYHSVRQILSMNPDAIVLPAHTSDTIKFDNRIIGDTIANISARSKMTDMHETEFVEYAMSKIPPTPPNYTTIATINRKGSADGQILADLEAGGNHCAIR